MLGSGENLDSQPPQSSSNPSPSLLSNNSCQPRSITPVTPEKFDTTNAVSTQTTMSLKRNAQVSRGTYASTEMNNSLSDTLKSTLTESELQEIRRKNRKKEKREKTKENAEAGTRSVHFPPIPHQVWGPESQMPETRPPMNFPYFQPPQVQPPPVENSVYYKYGIPLLHITKQEVAPRWPPAASQSVPVPNPQTILQRHLQNFAQSQKEARLNAASMGGIHLLHMEPERPQQFQPPTQSRQAWYQPPPQGQQPLNQGQQPPQQGQSSQPAEVVNEVMRNESRRQERRERRLVKDDSEKKRPERSTANVQVGLRLLYILK